MPFARMVVMSRFTPTLARASSYGPSVMFGSKPEWYATKLTFGWALAAGPKSAGDACGDV